tara:strand:- start:513 stop:1445 length:933 start_codon:yes stop_codon:yes gene_type:complete
MLVNDAMDEHMLHSLVKNQLHKIKNYNKYFIFGEAICDVANMSDKEIDSLIKNCDGRLVQEYETNGSRNMMIIQMPYGGEDVDRYIYDMKHMPINKQARFVKEMCNHLANLIEKAILPMNNLNVYHGDMKSSNMVWDGKSSPKIIDWGLSKQSNDDTMYTYKGIHFNYPYETLLFNLMNGLTRDEFEVQIERLLTEYSDKILRGHIKLDIMICSGVEKNQDVIRVLRKYLISVASACTNSNGKFSKTRLLKLYKKKQDIWGAMTVLIDLLQMTHNKQELQTESNNMIAIWEHIFDNPNIKVNRIISMLKN